MFWRKKLKVIFSLVSETTSGNKRHVVSFLVFHLDGKTPTSFLEAHSRLALQVKKRNANTDGFFLVTHSLVRFFASLRVSSCLSS